MVLSATGPRRKTKHRGTATTGQRTAPAAADVVKVVAEEAAATPADRILAEDLPKSVEDFVATYRGIKLAAELLAPPSPVPARRLSQVVRHLRDVSWPAGLVAAQAQCLAMLCVGLLPTVQGLLSLAAHFDLQAALDKGTTPPAFLAAALLCMEVAAMYCALAGTLGAPSAVLVEEVGIAVVQCLKQCLRQLVTPLLSPPEPERGRRNALPTGVASAGKTLAALFSPEEAAEACIGAAAAIQELHEFLCRHRLADEQLHQLVHMAMGVFFCPEPHFRLCTAAEELLVTIFCRREALRGSLLQELLAGVPQLPSGKRARKFQLPVAEDNPDYGLSTWTHLLLRLSQSTCLPMREVLGAEVEFTVVLSHRVAAQAVLQQLTSGLLQRLLLARARDEEARALLDELLDELLLVAFRPPWPGALALVRTLAQQLISVVHNERKKEGVDTSSAVREFALKLLSKVTICLWNHHVEASHSHITLPAWDEPLEQISKEQRLLQHIALRASLQDGGTLPWTPAAKAMDAWDAELCLASGGMEQTGLGHFTDDIVFRYLTLAHLEDERVAAARCPQTAGAPSALSAAVFSAGHPIHARSFLICHWAEACIRQQRTSVPPDDAATESAGEKLGEEATEMQQNGQHAVVEQVLARLWTSRAPLEGEGCMWHSGDGRRVLLPFTVYKVYRQLRITELDSLRKASLDCIVMQANAAQATLRKTAVRTLSDLVDVDASVLSAKPVEETVDMRLRDESSLVRQVSLDLLGRVLEGSLGSCGDDDEVLAEEAAGESAVAPVRLEPSGQVGAVASAMLLRFQQTVRGRINDTSVLVRRQASKILSAFVLNHPEHPDVVGVVLDLVRRSADSETLRSLVLGTFELLWFMDDEPTPQAAQQFARVVDASRNLSNGSGEQGRVDVLDELLRRFKKNISSRRHSRGFEFAVQRWTTLLLNEFVQLSGTAPIEAERLAAEPDENTAIVVWEGPWVRKRALLSTLEAFAAVQPREMQVHLRPLAVYLALEESASDEERWVAQKACRILCLVLPYVTEQRGLVDHRQVQQDLQALIRSQPSAGVHEAVRCLCLVVKYVTGDLGQLVSHLNVAVPTLSHLCRQGEAASGSLERIQLMCMCRQVWVLSSVVESLAVDDYVHKGGAEPAKGRRMLPRSALRFDFVGGSVASTAADLLARLYALGEPQLRTVIVTCLGFFLRGQRLYLRDHRVGEIFSSALASCDLALCLRALETLASLLAHFGGEAEKETRRNFKDDRDSPAGGSKFMEHRTSAVESAQPLAVHSDAVLAHVALAGSIGPVAAPHGNAQLLRVRAEALAVVRQLHRQGLVNPMTVLPRVFALSFAGETLVSEPASAMLKEMLALRPTLLLNRLDEAFREAFLAVLAGAPAVELGEALGLVRLTGLGELYAECFRRQKTTREAFIRKALRELLRLQAGRCQDRFEELMTAASSMASRGTESTHAAPADTQPTSKRARLGQSGPAELAAASGMPLMQRYQLLYAEFVASALSSLPFVYESEPLLIVHECNHHLSLRAGALLASADQPEGGATRGAASPLAAPDAGAGTDAASSAAGDGQDMGADTFAEAVSILACLLLKRAVKAEYGLSVEQCAQFNPKEMRQERLKGAAASRAGVCAEDVPGSARFCFPNEEWLRLSAPLLRGLGSPAEMSAYMRSITDSECWDTSPSHHATAIERLEGQPTVRRGSGGDGSGRRGRGRRRAKGGRAKRKKAAPVRTEGEETTGPLEEDDDPEEGEDYVDD